MTKAEFMQGWWGTFADLTDKDEAQEMRDCLAEQVDALISATREEVVRELKPSIWVGPDGAVDLAKTVAAAREEQRAVDDKHYFGEGPTSLTATPLADRLREVEGALSSAKEEASEWQGAAWEAENKLNAALARVKELEARLDSALGLIATGSGDSAWRAEAQRWLDEKPATP